MKKNIRGILSFVTVLVMLVVMAVPAFAASSPFQKSAYATIITASDFQAEGESAYDRFEKIITLMKKDGLTDPSAALIGGDYSKTYPDNATPGVKIVKEKYTKVYPKESADSVICIQGNHDFVSAGFTKSGFYDMDTFCLYVINENDFCWNQFVRTPVTIKATANKVEKALNEMIDNKDYRPVIILTHVPLHHSGRSSGGDNMYSSYLFNVINKAAEKLDIVFLFGHNHSGAYDDYIGGSVNFLKPGDTIRIPKAGKISSDDYTEETLNFTYTNSGYVGYSNNGTENGSTNILTAGAIQISKNKIRFVKYSEKGLYKTYDVQRKNKCTDRSNSTDMPEIQSEYIWDILVNLLEFIKENTGVTVLPMFDNIKAA